MDTKNTKNTPTEGPPPPSSLMTMMQTPTPTTGGGTPAPPAAVATPVDTPFWGQDPNILFQPAHIWELFPTENMSYNRQLNAITRAVILLTLLSLLFSYHRGRLLVVGLLTLGVVYLLHQYHMNQLGMGLGAGTGGLQEGLDILRPSPALDYLNDAGLNTEPTVFQQPTAANPFSNVMMSDYDYNPNKLPAPPTSNSLVEDMIKDNAKKLIQQVNPGQPDIDQKLFQDITDQLGFEQSMRQFYSNPSTTIPNDQGAFAEFCYGSMVSCKEGNLFACARNTSHYTNY